MFVPIYAISFAVAILLIAGLIIANIHKDNERLTQKLKDIRSKHQKNNIPSRWIYSEQPLNFEFNEYHSLN